MTAGWCLVNLAIVAASRNGPASELAPLREFLALNLGLNCAYIGVGATVGRLSMKPFSAGMGWAAALQGGVLLVLDGYLLWQLPAALPK